MSMTAAQMVATAASTIRSFTPAQVEAHVYTGSARIVDIREPEELDEQGLIAGAYHVPRGLLEFWADPTSASYHPELDPDTRTILYCAAGHRSALAADTLRRLGYGDVGHLEGGIEAWKRDGLPVVGLKPWHRADATRPGGDGGAA